MNDLAQTVLFGLGGIAAGVLLLLGFHWAVGSFGNRSGRPR